MLFNEQLFSFNKFTEDEEFIRIIINTISDLEMLQKCYLYFLKINDTHDMNPLKYINVDQNYFSELVQCRYK